MTTSVSTRINILCIKFKIRTCVLYNNAEHPVTSEGRKNTCMNTLLHSEGRFGHINLV